MSVEEKPPSPWAQHIAYFVREIGLHSAVVLVFLGMAVGWIPSLLTRQHEDIIKLLSINNILMVGGFYNSSAKCLNDADTLPVPDARIARSRCELAQKQTLATLKNMGMVLPE